MTRQEADNSISFVERKIIQATVVGKHNCRLVKRLQSPLPRLPPTARLFSRLTRSFQKLIIAWENHPLTRIYLRSQNAIALEKKRHGRSSTWWIIHPCSKLRFIWDNVMLLTFLYFFFAIPYLTAFIRLSRNDDKRDQDWLKLVFPVQIICIIDIFMSFLTGYVSLGGSDIILIPGLIARNFTQGYFLLDLLTSIPCAWFSSTPPNLEVNFLAVIAELVPLLKIFRMSTLRCYVKQICSACCLSSVESMVAWYTLLSILIFHWSACLTWSFPFVALYATRTPLNNSEAYIFKSGTYQESFSYVYLISLHMGVSNLVGSSLIELKDTFIYDKLIRCVILLFGTGYTIYVIVVFLQLVESSAEHELNHQEVMKTVREYIKEKNLPDNLRDRLLEHFKYHYHESNSQENTVIKTLSSHLRQEIIALSHRDLVKNSEILRNLPEKLLVDIMRVVKSVNYHRGDIIYRAGSEAADCMYFISRGTVAIVNNSGKIIGRLKDGDNFGEISLVYPGEKRAMSIIAEETCQLVSLNRKNFERLVPRDSELRKKLTNIAKYRLEQMALENKLSQEEKFENLKKATIRKVLLKTRNI